MIQSLVLRPQIISQPLQNRAEKKLVKQVLTKANHTNQKNQISSEYLLQDSIDADYEDLLDFNSSKPLKTYKQILAMKYNYYPTLDYYS